MQDFIRISQINDFIFCPFSIYLHGIYENFSEKTYHSSYQTRGKIKHESVDKGKYSTSKNILQGTEIYSDKYRLTGKIDTFDAEKGKLVERKNKIAAVYDGYRYQLWAQYFCLAEMGYMVKEIALHSLTDNKSYPLPLPDKSATEKFEAVLDRIRNFDPRAPLAKNPKKCEKCIYNNLCN
jgi:CRISPR-associated protein Cas4